MRTPKIILCTLLLSITLLPSAVHAGASSPRFPAITSYSLAKAKVTLPGAFSSNLNLLLISFSPGETPELKHWVSTAKSLSGGNRSLNYYLFPISAQRNPLYRWWDNSAMRSDFSDPQLWPRVIPLYVNENSFRQQLQIPSAEQITVLLVDRSGSILWRASGAPNQQKIQALQAQLHS